MPPWPESAQTPESVLSDSSRLCVECGLCCTGAFLSWAPVTDDEITTYSDTVIRPYQDPDLRDDEDPLRMVLPCACHIDGLCSIFPDRPSVCSDYRCDLLRATMNGSIEGQKAREITAKIKAQFEWLKLASERLGYVSRSRPSLYSVLQRFIRDVEPRMRFAPAYPHEAQFVRRAFEYLQNVDRHLEAVDYLSSIGDIVGSLEKPRPGFDVPAAEICRLRLGERHALELRNCPELVEQLRAVIKGWDLRQITEPEAVPRTILRVWKSDGRYYWDMPFPGFCGGKRKPIVEPIDLLDEIHYCLDDLYTFENPTHFFLHSAAVEINGRIVLLLGTHKTGKTTLSMALAARGHRLLADDRIAIDSATGRAVAVGSVPLLRKPFPADEGFWPAKSLVKKYRGPEDDGAAYVDLPDTLFAPKGYSGPVAAIIMLELSDTPIATSLKPVSMAEALKVLVLQYWRGLSGNNLLASEALDGMIKLAERAPAYSLNFARTKMAIRQIEGIVSGEVAPTQDRALTERGG
jgi:hypothetical protein